MMLGYFPNMKDLCKLIESSLRYRDEIWWKDLKKNKKKTRCHEKLVEKRRKNDKKGNNKKKDMNARKKMWETKKYMNEKNMEDQNDHIYEKKKKI